MKQAVVNVRRAWSLLKSDNRIETYAAVVLVVVTVGPLAYYVWKMKRRIDRGESVV